MKDAEIHWEAPESFAGKAGMQADGVNAATGMKLKDVENATVRNSASKAIQVSGARSRKSVVSTEAAVSSTAEVARDVIVRR